MFRDIGMCNISGRHCRLLKKDAVFDFDLALNVDVNINHDRLHELGIFSVYGQYMYYNNNGKYGRP